MILTGQEIAHQIENGRIIFDPFEASRINPNSIDITLGPTLLRYKNTPLDPRKDNEVEVLTIPQEGFLLTAGSFWLGSSMERLGSQHYVPIVHAKSSTARAGLFVHVTADLIDIGSIGQITFQLYSIIGLRVFVGMPLGRELIKLL